MKLRIHQQSLRFRLTQADVDEFLKGGEIENVIKLAAIPSAFLGIKLACRGSILCATFEDQVLRIVIPQNRRQQFANEEVVTLKEEIEVGDGDCLRIVVEKDFACLKHRDGPDDFDTFKYRDSAKVC